MGKMLIQTQLAGRSPEDLQRAVDEDEQWQEAKRAGLVAAQVLVDPTDDDTAFVLATWPNAELAREKTPDLPQPDREAGSPRVVAYSPG